jgi:hypothetical protein
MQLLRRLDWLGWLGRLVGWLRIWNGKRLRILLIVLTGDRCLKRCLDIGKRYGLLDEWLRSILRRYEVAWWHCLSDCGWLLLLPIGVNAQASTGQQVLCKGPTNDSY